VTVSVDGWLLRVASQGAVPNRIRPTSQLIRPVLARRQLFGGTRRLRRRLGSRAEADAYSRRSDTYFKRSDTYFKRSEPYFGDVLPDKPDDTCSSVYVLNVDWGRASSREMVRDNVGQARWVDRLSCNPEFV